MSAQDITLRGTMKDIATGLSIESSTIVVIGTSIAAKSDNNGKFILKISKANMGSSISVSSLGYKAFAMPIVLKKLTMRYCWSRLITILEMWWLRAFQELH